EIAGQPLIGALYFPGLDESISAMSGEGAWYQRSGTPARRVQVSQRSHLADAVIVTSDGASFAKRNASAGWRRIESSCSFTRTWGDAYGYMLVATGRVEAMIDPILSVWDAAAVMPIVMEAGGTFTDWSGQPRIDSGDACGSNGKIHADILNLLHTA
ncbi:MAG TPA: inositol monophosphatase family protein, partial [Pirellulaceae bacterium]|nr:inositol monophosphatase family protein [Pirellulaceae bacterium]